MVYIKKKSKVIRVCTDFSRGFNNALKSYHYSLPWLEEVFAQLSRGGIFSKIDQRDAYLQIEVDDESSELFTINTHEGYLHIIVRLWGLRSSQLFFSK